MPVGVIEQIQRLPHIGPTSNRPVREALLSPITPSAPVAVASGQPRKAAGFSFIELLMVIAVVGILAAMAVPHVHRVKITSQEKAAQASIRVIFGGQALYNSRFQTYGQLDQLVAEGFIDNGFQGGPKNGYVYTVVRATANSFEVTAVPQVPGQTGIRGFFLDETGVLRFSEDGSPPTASSPAWQ